MAASGAGAAPQKPGRTEVKERFAKMMDLSQELVETPEIKPSNQFLDAEIVVGGIVNIVFHGPALIGMLGHLSDMRHRVSVLPPAILELRMDAKHNSEPAPGRTYAHNSTWIRSLLMNMPPTDPTGLAHFVLIPLSLQYVNDSGHCNALIVDRKAKQAFVVEPHGAAEAAILFMAHGLLPPEYRVLPPWKRRFWGAPQKDLPFCQTWAPFLASQIVRMAVQDGSTLEDASTEYYDVINEVWRERAKVIDDRLTAENGGSQLSEDQIVAMVTTLQKRMDHVGMLVAAAQGAEVLRHCSAAGFSGRDLVAQAIECLVTRDPTLITTIVQRKFSGSEGMVPAFNEWLSMIHYQPRCASLNVNSDGHIVLVPGFAGLVQKQTTDVVRQQLLRELKTGSKTTELLTSTL